MRTIARMGVAGVLVLAALGTSTANAHTGWSVEGSFQASPRFGCGVSPTCLAFTAGGNASGTPCNPALASADGVDVSIVPLPSGTAGHRARITWNASAGPVSVLAVGFIAQFGMTCLDAAMVQIDNENFPPAGVGSGIVQIDPRAKFAYVNGENAFNVTWKLEGIDD